MEKAHWIRDLIKAEEQMEESGIVDFTAGFDADRTLAQDSIEFLNELKTDFVDAASSFNELKASTLGRVKIYGIAKTHADFMLFRNGFKMIFSMLKPGLISIRFNFIGSNFIPQPGTSAMQNAATPLMEENLIEAKWGAFGELIWVYQGQSINRMHLVRHYMTLFIKESAK